MDYINEFGVNEINMFEYKYVYYVKNMIISDRKYIYIDIYMVYIYTWCLCQTIWLQFL